MGIEDTGEESIVCQEMPVDEEGQGFAVMIEVQIVSLEVQILPQPVSSPLPSSSPFIPIIFLPNSSIGKPFKNLPLGPDLQDIGLNDILKDEKEPNY